MSLHKNYTLEDSDRIESDIGSYSMDYVITSTNNIQVLYDKIISFFLESQPYDIHSKIIEKTPPNYLKIYHYFEGSETPRGQEKNIELNLVQIDEKVIISIHFESLNRITQLPVITNAQINWSEIVFDLTNHLDISLTESQLYEMFPIEYIRVMKKNELNKIILVFIGVLIIGFFVYLSDDSLLLVIFLLATSVITSKIYQYYINKQKKFNW